MFKKWSYYKVRSCHNTGLASTNRVGVLQCLILTSILQFGCNFESNNYLKNKFQIVGFTLLSIDSCNAELKFEVKYYSDSTYQNRFSDAIEKGQDGSDSEIIFYGETKSCYNEDDTTLPDLNKISNYFNKKIKAFKGEKIQKVFSVNFSEYNNPKNVFMILENIRTGNRDTIINNVLHSNVPYNSKSLSRDKIIGDWELIKIGNTEIKSTEKIYYKFMKVGHLRIGDPEDEQFYELLEYSVNDSILTFGSRDYLIKKLDSNELIFISDFNEPKEDIWYFKKIRVDKKY